MTVTANIVNNRVLNLKKKKFLMGCIEDNSEYIKQWLINSDCEGIACKVISVSPLCPTTVTSCRKVKTKIKIKELSNTCND